MAWTKISLARKLMVSVSLLLLLLVGVAAAVVMHWPAETVGMLFFLFVLALALQCILTYHIHVALARLKHFAGKAERNLLRKSDFTTPFPENELGEVAQHIIMLYKKLSEAKEALYIEKEKMRMEQEERERLKRQLTHSIAQELRGPVGEIQDILGTLLASREVPAGPVRQALDDCYVQSTRLSKLAADISLLSRLDEGAESLGKEVIDVARVARGVMAGMAPQLEQHSIVLHHDLDHPLPVNGNESLLATIFRNLLENVVSYAGDHTEVWISCYREDGEFYYFRFADSGAGVNSHDLSFLLGRFYKGEKERLSEQGGTGLGLAIVKNAVLFHGGAIQVRNRKEGGLEFDFTLSNVIRK